MKAEKNLERTSQAFYSTFINLCQTSVNRTPTPSLCGDPVLKLFLELSRGDLPFVAVLTLLKKPTVSKNEESPKPYEHKRVILRSTTGAPGGIRTHDPWFRRPMLYPLSYGRLRSNYNPSDLLCRAINIRLIPELSLPLALPLGLNFPSDTFGYSIQPWEDGPMAYSQFG